MKFELLRKGVSVQAIKLRIIVGIIYGHMIGVPAVWACRNSNHMTESSLEKQNINYRKEYFV